MTLCRRAVSDDGRRLVHDQPLDASIPPHFARFGPTPWSRCLRRALDMTGLPLTLVPGLDRMTAEWSQRRRTVFRSA